MHIFRVRATLKVWIMSLSTEYPKLQLLKHLLYEYLLRHLVWEQAVGGGVSPTAR